MSDLYIANSCGEGFSEGNRISVANFWATNECGVRYFTTKYFNQDTGKVICGVDMCKLDCDLNLLRSLLYLERNESAETENIVVTVNNASSSSGNTTTNNNTNTSSGGSSNNSDTTTVDCTPLNKTISFNLPSGNVGITNTYSMNNVDISASGFTKTGSTTAMWGKNDGVGETGLGIASDSDHEINKSNFIQLDLTSLINEVKPTTIPIINIDSIHPSEGFAIYGSNSNGTLGSLLYDSPNTPSLQSIEIPNFGTYKFINIIASGASNNSNVLLKSIDYVICK